MLSHKVQRQHVRIDYNNEKDVKSLPSFHACACMTGSRVVDGYNEGSHACTVQQGVMGDQAALMTLHYMGNISIRHKNKTSWQVFQKSIAL